MTDYLSEIWRLRYFWMALVRNDLRNRYRRSVIGIGWSLLHPIAMTVVLCVVLCPLFHQNVREYAPFLLSGLTLWGFIMAVVMQGCHCFFQGESYIRQHPAPLAIYPLRTTLGAGFHFLLGLAIAMVFVWIVNGFGNLPALLSLLPTMVLLFRGRLVAGRVHGSGQRDVSGLAAPDRRVDADSVLRHADHIQDRSAWPIGRGWRGSSISIRSPYSWNLIRQPLLYGEMPSLRAISLGALTGLVAVGAAALALKRFEKRMIFYL